LEQFLGYAIPGIPYGCTYAIVAVGIVLTYQATGVFNFAYGAQAYLSAYVFTRLVQSQHLNVWLAFFLSVVLLGPLVGLAFDKFLFRKIAPTNTTAKLVTGISLFVGIPAILPVLFGSALIYNSPSILFNPNTVYFTVVGTPVNGLYVTAVLATAVVLVALTFLLRFTNLGLQMRATVESRRLAQLNGINSGRVGATAWGVSGLLAGLAGVLLAPNYAQLQSSDYATLMVGAFAAAAWALLRSLPIATLVAIALGVTSTILPGYLPVNSIWTSAAFTSLPFVVLAAALLLLPGLRRLEDVKDPLSSVDPPAPPIAATMRMPQLDRVIKVLWYLLLAAFVVSMLTWLPTIWEGVFNAGLVFSTLFLSITLITGMGAQLSLAQGTLAGVAAFTAAQLTEHFKVNFLVGGVLAMLVAAAVAVVLAVASVRLRGLGLALLTISAALFFDNAVFPEMTSGASGQSISVPPGWVGLGLMNPNGHAFFIFSMVIMLACIALVQLVRRGTSGRFLEAMRGSQTGSAGLGINLTGQHVAIFALSGLVAGIGGVLLAVQQGDVSPNSFNYEVSLVFVVIVVTTGAITIEGALQAGFGFVVLQQLLTYVPARLGGNSLVVVLFAVGALTYAAHPEGILEFQKRRWNQRIERLLFSPEALAARTAARGARGGSAEPPDAGVNVAAVEPVGSDG
jgi:branched-subunit amino acid ABC-type transport system permease component